MALTFEWDPVDRGGNQDCWFWHGVDHVQMHACDVIVKAWKDGKARDAWAATEAQKIIARMDYEMSDAGKLAAGQRELEALQMAVAAKAVEVAALDAKVSK